MASVILKREVDAFLRARDLLQRYRLDYDTAYSSFQWPLLNEFNWAVDYFDNYAKNNSQTALWIVNETGEEKFSFAELSRRSNQVANFLRRHNVCPGDRILVMLPNGPAIWEIMLAALKIGAVVIPASTLLSTEDLSDRLYRGKVSHVIANLDAADRFAGVPGSYKRMLVAGTEEGWLIYEDSYSEPAVLPALPALSVDSPYLLYFTSGTTALPKMVLHTRQSYPVGHLATMYWTGLRSDDIHFNISSPGWAKHAWSSVFSPWNAGATVFVHNYRRFDARKTLEVIADCGVTSICAPPTVWRMLVLQDLASYRTRLRSMVGAGEPLNAEIIAKVKAAWGLDIRDGYGQSETVALLGNFPGQNLKPGCVGKPTPGNQITLIGADGRSSAEGEICLRLENRPLGLMTGYMDDPHRATAHATEAGYYRTGDIASRDADGYFTFIGRADDVFKSSDYRISPFELESALIEHDSVAEAAVVPSPDSVRTSVPKAFIVLKPGVEPSAEVARDIFRFLRSRLSPYKRIRRIEFSDLPKTVSGKIRRVELRNLEIQQQASQTQGLQEYLEEQFL